MSSDEVSPKSSDLIKLVDRFGLVFDNILSHLDVLSVLTLRKVCHVTRSYIDENLPDYNVEMINLFVNEDELQICYNNCFGSAVILYSKQQNGCSVGKCEKLKYLKGEDYVDIFLADLKLVIAQRKSTLSLLKMRLKYESEEQIQVSNRIFQCLHEVLKSRSRLFPVKSIHINWFGEDQTMLILPFIDSDSLEKISMSNFYGLQSPFKLERISELKQWKSAKTVHLLRTNTHFIKYFSHCEEVWIRLGTVTLNDFAQLEEMFIHNPKLRKFQFRYKSLEETILSDVLTRPRCYIQIPRNDQMLYIFHNPPQVVFARVELTTVPKHAYILS